MELLIFMAVLVILDVAAFLWGADSRVGFTGDRTAATPAWYPI